jgi:hypothetical protein
MPASSRLLDIARSPDTAVLLADRPRNPGRHAPPPVLRELAEHAGANCGNWS